MLRYLLDTNIISEIIKIAPNEKVLAKFLQFEDSCAISAISIQELAYGLELSPKGRRKEQLTEAIDKVKTCLPVFDFNSFCAEIAGEILAQCEKIGERRPYSDAQIAATTIANSLVLVTRNVKDFEPISKISPLKYENWF